LQELAKEHPLPSFIMQYRELSKLKNTYIDGLPEYVNKKTGRIHTTYSQNRVATGRLASSDPNMQNIPVDGLGLQVRAAFRPQTPGHVFIAADYSQIELRVLAYLSQDTNLLEAFNSNKDIHTQTAAALFGESIEAVTKEQRSVGKRINFSILYGITPYGLSRDLQISLTQAREYIEKYFEQYPGVRVWMDTVIAKTEQHGYTETFFGRRRPVPGIHEQNKNLKELACRIAINTVGQGTAAEIMKMGMLAVNAALTKTKYQARVLLQIHDELLVEVAEHDAGAVEALVKTALESVVAWNIPLVVDTVVGKNWQEVS
jgi:DNA polymerase-1